MKIKNKQGGPRPGAGRKYSGRRQYTTRLPQAQIDWIKARAAAQECDECKVVGDALALLKSNFSNQN